MEIHGIAVMRRRHDSWLNATQILKVAGVDKGKRTKILEKEIQTGEHEKIQGGYGKYQGTWIRFERGVEVCKQYGVEELLRPLLTYDMGQDGGVAGQGKFNTPTKEQAMAAQRKRMYNASNESRNNGAAGTFFKGISSTASDMVGIISKARFDSPGPKRAPQARNGLNRAPSFNRQQSNDDFPGNSQQSYVSDYAPNADSAYSTQNSQVNGDGTEPPRKRPRMAMTPADSFGYTPSMEMYANAVPGSPTEPNDSFIYSQGMDAPILQHDGVNPLPPLPFDVSPEADGKRSMLMNLFMDSGTDHSKYNILRTMRPEELDMPIDSQSHTPLHWAATLSRIPLLKALIGAGASPFRVNAAGETALMRACTVTNSHDHNSMPDLLDVLGGTIEVRDHKGRTVLHHIAVTSSIKGRSAASRYYLQCLLEWVVRSGSAPSSQNAEANGNIPSKLGLARFMGEIVNAQDKAGDTALHIAAKIGNRSIISQLLEVCADANIRNRRGLRPRDFGAGIHGTETTNGWQSQEGELSNVAGNSQKSQEMPDDIAVGKSNLLIGMVAALTKIVLKQLIGTAVEQFETEVKTRTESIDSYHNSLRMTSVQVAESERRLEMTEEKLKQQQLARQKIANLSRVREEEQYRLMELEQAHGRADTTASANWEVETTTAINASRNGGEVALPSAVVLKARINAIRARVEDTRKAEAALKGRSREVELKFRHLVALATRTSDSEADGHLDGLMRAVESEKGELEIGRVRRFLGGVEGVVQ